MNQDSATFIGQIIQAVGVLLAVAVSITALLKARKESASKEDVEAVNRESEKRYHMNLARSEELMKTITRVNDRIDALRKDRELAVEGLRVDFSHKIEQVGADRELSTNGLRAEIRGLAESVSSALQDNARAIGRLEGSHDLAKQIAQAISA